MSCNRSPQRLLAHSLASVIIVATMGIVACSHRDELDTLERNLSSREGGSGGQMKGSHLRDGTPIATTPRDSSSGGTDASSITSGSGGVNGSSAAVDGTRPTALILPSGLPTLLVTMESFKHYDEQNRSNQPELVTVENQPFTFARRFPLGSGNESPGSAGYFGQARGPIEKGDLLRVFFWARCVSPEPDTEQCRSGLVFEEVDEPYRNGGLELPIRVGREWTLVTQAFTSTGSFPANGAQLTFRLGFPRQRIELGTIGLENYGTSLSLATLVALDADSNMNALDSAPLLSYGTAVSTEQVGIEYPFGKAIRFVTTGQTIFSPEESGLQARISRTIHGQRPFLALLWARCISSARADGRCRSSLSFEEVNSPYINAGLAPTTFTVGTEWQAYYFPFLASRGYEVDTAKLVVHLGFSDQIIEFGPIEVRGYGPDFPLSNLPRSQSE
jgi:hypothetical protein